MADRQDILRKVQALLNKADSTTFSEERDALRKKADDYMLAYAISEFEIGQADFTKKTKPELRRIVVSEGGNPFRDQLVDLVSTIASHCRCQVVLYGASGPKKYRCSAGLVGFPADLDYAELLFASLHLQLSTEMEPKPDAALTYIENLVMLKETGMKWQRIHELLTEAGIMDPEDWAHKVGVRFTNDYTRYCKETGRPRQYTAPLTYQRNFAQGFVDTIALRLWEMKNNQNEVTTGKEIVLLNINKEVSDAFDEMFPKLKSLARRDDTKFDRAARQSGHDAGKRARIEGQHKVGTTKRGELS